MREGKGNPGARPGLLFTSSDLSDRGLLPSYDHQAGPARRWRSLRATLSTRRDVPQAGPKNVVFRAIFVASQSAAKARTLATSASAPA